MAIQLEFNIENKTSEEMQIYLMQKQIDQMCDSMDKVRRKLFSEISEMKKMYTELHKENRELKTILKKLKNEKTEWVYQQNDTLFNEKIPESQFECAELTLFLEHKPT